MLRATAWSELDLPRLKGLIESSFGRTLVPDYFEKTRLLRAYVSENYRTAVILTDEAEGVYLDKFAVLDDAQGEGLGRAVWNVMLEETRSCSGARATATRSTTSTTPSPMAATSRTIGKCSGSVPMASTASRPMSTTAPNARRACWGER